MNIALKLASLCAAAGLMYVGYTNHVESEQMRAELRDLKQKVATQTVSNPVAETKIAASPAPTSSPKLLEPSNNLQLLLSQLSNEEDALQQIIQQLAEADDGTSRVAQITELENELKSHRDEKNAVNKQLQKIDRLRKNSANGRRQLRAKSEFATFENEELLLRQIATRKARIDRLNKQIAALNSKKPTLANQQRINALLERSNNETTSLEGLSERLAISQRHNQVTQSSHDLKYESEDAYLADVEGKLKKQYQVDAGLINKLETQLNDLKRSQGQGNSVIEALNTKREAHLKKIDELETKIANERKKIQQGQ